MLECTELTTVYESFGSTQSFERIKVNREMIALAKGDVESNNNRYIGYLAELYDDTGNCLLVDIHHKVEAGASPLVTIEKSALQQRCHDKMKKILKIVTEYSSINGSACGVKLLINDLESKSFSVRKRHEGKEDYWMHDYKRTIINGDRKKIKNLPIVQQLSNLFLHGRFYHSR